MFLNIVNRYTYYAVYYSILFFKVDIKVEKHLSISMKESVSLDFFVVCVCVICNVM